MIAKLFVILFLVSLVLYICVRDILTQLKCSVGIIAAILIAVKC